MPKEYNLWSFTKIVVLTLCYKVLYSITHESKRRRGTGPKDHKTLTYILEVRVQLKRLMIA